MLRTRQDETAPEAFARFEKEAAELLAELPVLLQKTRERHAEAPKNWGIVGDLEEATRQLRAVRHWLG